MRRPSCKTEVESMFSCPTWHPSLFPTTRKTPLASLLRAKVFFPVPLRHLWELINAGVHMTVSFLFFKNKTILLGPVYLSVWLRGFGGETRRWRLNQHMIPIDVAKLFTYFSTISYGILAARR